MKNNAMLQNNIKLIEKATKKIKSFAFDLIDDGSFVETDAFTAGKSFLDGSEALGEGVVTGYATIGNRPVHFFAQNQEVLKGSFGEAHAKKILKVIRKAVQTGTPLISIIDSNGARVGEGVAMLEAYSEVINSINLAKENIPHICIIKGNCVGMMASIAAMADFVFMSDSGIMSVASPQAIAAKEKDYPKLNSLLGYNAISANSDMVDFSFKTTKELAEKLNYVLTICGGEVEQCEDDANRETPALDKAYSVETALKAICDNQKYIIANENYAKEVVTSYALVNSISVGIIALDGSVNDGYISANGIAKADKFIDKCSANGMPIISLVDCLGVKVSLADEVNGLAGKLANLMTKIASCASPMISVITGKAIGLAYSVFASKGIGFDYTLASVDSVISPVGTAAGAAIEYAEELKSGEDREKLEARYLAMEQNPFISAKDGFIDNIIELSTMRPYIASALMMLLGI